MPKMEHRDSTPWYRRELHPVAGLPVVLGVVMIFIGVPLYVKHDEEKHVKKRPVDQAWKAAKRLDSIDAYRSYLKENPSSSNSDKARAVLDSKLWAQAISTPGIAGMRSYRSHSPSMRYSDIASMAIEWHERGLQPDFVKDVEQAALAVDVKYNKSFLRESPIREILARLVESAGLKVFPNGYLKITVSAEATYIAADYRATQYRDTQAVGTRDITIERAGGNIQGEIVVEGPGDYFNKRRFWGHSAPPQHYTQGAGETVFRRALHGQGSFICTIVDMLSDLYGPKFIALMARDRDPYVKECGLLLLEGLKEKYQDGTYFQSKTVQGN